MAPPRDLVDAPFDPATGLGGAVPGAHRDELDEKAWRPVACRLNLWHHWQKHLTDDGGRYHTCRDCGAYPRPPGWV